MLRKVVIIALLGIFTVVCFSQKRQNPTPEDVSALQPVKELPELREAPNQTPITGNIIDIDPTLVVGALMNRKDGVLYSLSSILKSDAKPQITVLKEVRFDNFIENSLVMKGGWLSFLSGQMNDKTKAEVSIIKSAKVTVPNTAFDSTKLEKITKAIPNGERSNYAIVIGYVEYILTGTLFTDKGNESKGGAFGVTFGHTWYAKTGMTQAEHTLMAVWAPLPIVETAGSQPTADLNALTVSEIKKGQGSKGGNSVINIPLKIVPLPDKLKAAIQGGK